MVKEGQEFKNYKELCGYLGEKSLDGRSKKLQLERWQRSFKWHKEGHKIFIDEVLSETIDDPWGGNNKHVKEFLPYVIFCLDRSGIENEYVGFQRMMKSELKLVDSSLYSLYNHRHLGQAEALRRRGIRSYESFLMFIYNFEYLARETLERCFNVLEKGGGITWKPAQIFIVGMNSKRKVYVTGYEEVLDRIETAVCNEMNPEKEKDGRRYLHVIKRDKELIEKFYKECIRRLVMDEQLVTAIKESYERDYGEEFVPEMIIEYYRLYYIESIDRKALRKWKLDKIDSIRLKKAFVNPDGPEKQTLKEKVYKDIFRRMNKKNKFGISEKDFENLKFLIQSGKLTKKNYKTKNNLMQDQDEQTYRGRGS